MYLGPKNDGRQVNKKFRKFERKYRDCIKRNGDKIGTQTCYDISTYHNVTLIFQCPNLVSVPFYAIPIFPFKFPKFFIYLYIEKIAHSHH